MTSHDSSKSLEHDHTRAVFSAISSSNINFRYSILYFFTSLTWHGYAISTDSTVTVDLTLFILSNTYLSQHTYSNPLLPINSTLELFILSITLIYLRFSLFVIDYPTPSICFILSMPVVIAVRYVAYHSWC